MPTVSRRARARGLTVAVLLLVALAAAAVGPTQRQYRRLARVPADSGDPLTTVPVDVAAIRRARQVIPRGSNYFVFIGPVSANPQLLHDVLGVSLYTLSPSLPVRRAAEASWILSYKAPTLVPPNLRPLSVHSLGDKVYAVRVSPR